MTSVILNGYKQGELSNNMAYQYALQVSDNGAKIKKAKDKKTLIIDISKVDVDNFAFSRFAAAIHPDRKLSLRSTLVKEVLNKKKPDEVKLPKSAEAFVKRMNKAGFTKAAIIAAIQGL